MTFKKKKKNQTNELFPLIYNLWPQCSDLQPQISTVLGLCTQKFVFCGHNLVFLHRILNWANVRSKIIFDINIFIIKIFFIALNIFLYFSFYFQGSVESKKAGYCLFKIFHANGFSLYINTSCHTVVVIYYIHWAHSTVSHCFKQT